MRVSGGLRGLSAVPAAVALALTLVVAAPAFAAEPVVGVTAGPEPPELVLFNSNAPAKTIERRPVVGLLAGEVIIGLDLRTASGELFGLSTLNRMLRIDPETGVATQLGGQLDPALFTSGQFGGFDFNPTVDRLRLVNAGEDNLRFNPFTFLPVDGDPVTLGIQPDTNLAYAAGDANAGQNPTVAAAAYSDNDNDPATPTTLYAIDTALDILVTQGGPDGTPSANAGQLFTRGSLGINATDLAGLDIVPGTTGGDGVAYLATAPSGQTSSTLYRVNLIGAPPVGQATALGTIAGDRLAGLALLPAGTIGFSPGPSKVSERKRRATITIRRTGETLSGANLAVHAPFRTVDRTADSPGDYKHTSGIVRFAPGQTQRTVKVELRRDRKREPTESFAIELGPYATGGAVIVRESHTVRIADND